MTGLELTDPELEDLPPSCKLVYLALDQGGPSTQAELADDLLLPNRTTRYALQRLEDAGLIQSRQDLTDARRRLYAVGDVLPG